MDSFRRRKCYFAMLLFAAVLLAATGCTGSPETETAATKVVALQDLPPLSVADARAAIATFEGPNNASWDVPRVTVPGECGGLGYASLDEAVARADAIVIGRVSSVEFIFDGETRQLARLEVEQVIRGKADQLFVLNIAGGPRIADEGLVLTQHPTNPLLVPGDRGLFLLQRMSLTAAYVPQGYSGQFRFSTSGRVETVLGNQFADEVRGIDSRSLVKAVEKLSAR